MNLSAKLISRLTSWVCWPFLREVTGMELVPKSGPGILAANHLSVFDGPLLGSVLNVRARHAHFVSYKYSFDHPFTGFFLKANQGIVLDTSSNAGKEWVLQECRRYLEEGHVVGFFPEAHTAPFEAMRMAKSGVALLALQTGAPVIPVGLVNTHKVVPRKGSLPGRRWRAASIHVGKPLDFSRQIELFGKLERRQSLDIVMGVSTMIMRKIAELSGQEYGHGRKALERMARLEHQVAEGAG
jgi:1-acyl-sn-glycerol-3-phosphate acyltransferase